MRGFVIFSFGLRAAEQEPGPCNERLGHEALRLIKHVGDEAVIVAQWEVARGLKALGVGSDLVVEPSGGGYLDSRGVWEEAKQLFAARGVTEVVPVAHPFLHLNAVKKMIRRDGFRVIDHKIGKIGYDPDPRNTQPWTRSAPALLKYAIRIKFGGSHGRC